VDGDHGRPERASARVDDRMAAARPVRGVSSKTTNEVIRARGSRGRGSRGTAVHAGRPRKHRPHFRSAGPGVREQTVVAHRHQPDAQGQDNETVLTAGETS